MESPEWGAGGAPPGGGDQGSTAPTVRNVKRGSKHACERCRRSKLKCLLDTVEESGKCRRCLETGSSCVFLPAAPRQRRRRTDARVSSLEKQLEEMKSLVRQLQGAQINPGTKAERASAAHENSSSNHESPNDTLSAGSTPSANVENDDSSSTRPQATSLSTISETAQRSGGDCYGTFDIVPGILGTDIVSKDDAVKYFNCFVNESIPLYPAVMFQAGDDFENLRYSRPVLLLAAITAGSAAGDPKIYVALTEHLRKYLVNQVFLEGRKSLELIQAILLFVFWHCPPDDLKALSFYQWIHIAGTMALQLGIDWRPSKPASGSSSESSNAPATEVQMEVWRTMFAVWEACSSVAISLQRRPLIEFSRLAEKALESFDKNATHIYDKRLIAWVRLQLISQETEAMKNDFKGKKETGLIGNNATHIATADIEKRFMEWETALEPGVMNGAITIHHMYCRMKLHELAMHQDSNLDDLLPPYLFRSNSNTKKRQGLTDINPSYVKALLSLVSACHATLDAIMSIDIGVLRRCPTVTLVRGVYAIKALSMIRESSRRSESDISKVIDDEDLRFDYYVNSIIGYYGTVSGELQRKTSYKIQGILQKIATFHRLEPLGPNGGSKPLDFKAKLQYALPSLALEQEPTEPAEPTGQNEVIPELNMPNSNFIPELSMFDYPDPSDPVWDQSFADLGTLDNNQSNGNIDGSETQFRYFYSNPFENTPRNTLQDFVQLTTPSIPFNAAGSYHFQQ